MKKNILHIVLILGFFLLPSLWKGLGIGQGGLFAQTGTAKAADKLYDQYLYHDAIYKYLGIKNKDENVNRKLADSYRLTGDPINAEKHYEALYTLGTYTPDDVWNYASVLMMNKKYPEALAKIKKYNSMKPGETRVEEILADKDYLKKIIADSGRFALKVLEFNTSECEYAPSYYNAQIVFVSSRPIYSFTEYDDNWTDKRFTNLYGGYNTLSKKGKPTLNSIREVEIRGRLSRKFNEGPASFSNDGLTMIFTRNTYVKDKLLGSRKERVLELWLSKLDVDGTWRNPVPLPFNNLEFNVGHPAISPDVKTLYFISDMPGGYGGTDIYMCTMTADGTFGPAINMGERINTEGDEMYPFMHQSNVLFFASNGHPGMGGLDLFCTKLSGDKVANIKPGKIINCGAGINSSMDDGGFILDMSMKTGFFSSNRLTGKGSEDIYGFDLLTPFKFNKTLNGTIKDKEDGEVLKGTIIKLYDSTGTVVSETVTDSNGFYSFDVEPNFNFSLTGNKDNYKEVKKNTTTKTQDEIVTVNLSMEKMLAVSLLCLVTDKTKNEPVDSVHMTVTDRNSNTVLYDVYTDAEGKWRHGLEKTLMNTTINYRFILEKNGYVGKAIDWSYRVYKEEEIKVYEYMDFTMGKIEIGVDLGKLLMLKPIYFDKGKWELRADARLELDKIVAAMMIYSNISIELDSHTDCRGSADDNITLSTKRAEASVAYIVSRGIVGGRLTFRGKGESEPVNNCVCEGSVTSNCPEEEHALNRRTTFIIVGISK